MDMTALFGIIAVLASGGGVNMPDLMNAIAGRAVAEVDAAIGDWFIAGWIVKALQRGDLKTSGGKYQVTAAYWKRIAPPKPRTEGQLKFARAVIAHRNRG